MASRDALATLVWAEIAISGFTQATVAEMAGITAKHLSQMINGRTVGSLDMVDRILAVLGRELVLTTRVVSNG